MSELYPAVSLFKELAENNLTMGGITVDAGIYGHLLVEIEDAEKKDQRLLGRAGEALTFEDLSVLLEELDELADDLFDEYGRTFACPEWKYDESTKKLSIVWSS